MPVNAQTLRQLCPNMTAAVADEIANAFAQYAAAFGVTTLLREAHFFGQMAHESAGFTAFTENLNYRADTIARVWPRLADRADELAHNPQALANAAYASRYGNGDEASGDGWRYRGRGIVQLTFHDNYQQAGQRFGLDLVGNPDLAADPGTATRVALNFWNSKGCNAKADADDCAAVTRIINGGDNGLADRQALTNKAKTLFA